MRSIWIAGLIIGLSTAAAAAFAAKIVECVDGRGNVTFMDRCPPDMTRRAEKHYGPKPKQAPSSKSLQGIAEQQPITLYAVSECDACDVIRTFLQTRQLPYTEKNVEDNVELQQELRDKSGQLAVPVVTIGDRVLRGYDRLALSDAITEAGYPDKQTAEPPPVEDDAATENES